MTQELCLNFHLNNVTFIPTTKFHIFVYNLPDIKTFHQLTILPLPINHRKYLSFITIDTINKYKTKSQFLLFYKTKTVGIC